jgi:hypothetical protein
MPAVAWKAVGWPGTFHSVEKREKQVDLPIQRGHLKAFLKK